MTTNDASTNVGSNSPSPPTDPSNWVVRINPPTPRRLAAAALLVAVWTAVVPLASSVHATDRPAVIALEWALYFVLLSLALLVLVRQLIVTPRELIVRTWWDSIRGNAGRVRDLDETARVIRYPNGGMTLAGGPPIGLSAFRRDRPALVDALGRAGVEIVDRNPVWRFSRMSLRLFLLVFVAAWLVFTLLFGDAYATGCVVVAGALTYGYGIA